MPSSRTLIHVLSHIGRIKGWTDTILFTFKCFVLEGTINEDQLKSQDYLFCSFEAERVRYTLVSLRAYFTYAAALKMPVGLDWTDTMGLCKNKLSIPANYTLASKEYS